jgi:hypothetical protein
MERLPVLRAERFLYHIYNIFVYIICFSVMLVSILIMTYSALNAVCARTSRECCQTAAGQREKR